MGRVAGGVMAEPVRARRLTDEEGRRLQQIVRRGKHESIRVRRAMIIMASASGTPVPAIARLVAAHEDTVRDVIHRFNEIGLRALDPNWAGGRPRRISADDETYIVTTATARPTTLGRKGGDHTLAAFQSIRAARPDGAPIYIICDNLSANTTPAIRVWARRNKVELCLTPT